MSLSPSRNECTPTICGNILNCVQIQLAVSETMALSQLLIRYPIHLTALTGRSIGNAFRGSSALQLPLSRVTRDVAWIAGRTPLCTYAQYQSTPTNNRRLYCHSQKLLQYKMDDANKNVPRPKRPSTEETSPAETIELPVYQPEAKAADVFQNVYFYGEEAFIELCRKRRENTLQNMTVKEVYLK